MKMISSTAFPKVTFIRAATVSPQRPAMLSVAWLRRPATGIIAIAFMAKTMPAGTDAKSAEYENQQLDVSREQHMMTMKCYKCSPL